MGMEKLQPFENEAGASKCQWPPSNFHARNIQQSIDGAKRNLYVLCFVH
jgi:hypothetical protein